MRDILVTGGTGQVGGYIAGRHRDGFHFLSPDRSELDLADRGSLARMIASRSWAAVINTAAYTAVDKAEADASTAWRINADGPKWLAEETARGKIPLVHVSTDYVFSGDLDRPYEEDDATGPLAVYGASKEAGERFVRKANLRHAIVRTSWVVSARGENFVKTMLRLAGEGAPVRVVEDQQGAPTNAAELADALMTVAIRLATDLNAPTGNFHFTNDGCASWADVAEEVFRTSAAHGGPSAIVQRIDSSAFPRPARRPKNSRLAPGRLPESFGVTRRPWRAAIGAIVEDIMQSGTS